MNSRGPSFAVGMALLLGVSLTGCSKPAVQTGFLSDYSKLEKAESGNMRYASLEIAYVTALIVDPVELRIQDDPPLLNAEERAEVANYMREALIGVFRDAGYQIVAEAGVGVARMRVAITDVQKSKWWLNLHPVSKVTGAGSGGASMEAEVVDSVHGRQIGAVVQAGKGNQFKITNFKSIDGVKDRIDGWAKALGKRIAELREQRRRIDESENRS